MSDEQPPEFSLLNGSTPASPTDVESSLQQLSVDFVTAEHPPMFTVADSMRYRDDVPGGYSKNLFLRNRKGRMWLVTLLEDRQVDLRLLGETIGAGRVSFASPTRLMQHLGVIPGSVSPLAVINDLSGVVTTVIDSALLEFETVHFHPCVNTMTTSMSPTGLLKYMRHYEHNPDHLPADFFSHPLAQKKAD